MMLHWQAYKKIIQLDTARETSEENRGRYSFISLTKRIEIEDASVIYGPREGGVLQEF